MVSVIIQKWAAPLIMIQVPQTQIRNHSVEVGLLTTVSLLYVFFFHNVQT